MNSELPLAGKTILLTRSARQSKESKALFETQGAEVWIQPTIEILPLSEWRQEITQGEFNPISLTKGLARFDRLIFSSSNGVDYFLSPILSLPSERENLDILTSIPIAAVGPGTAAALEKRGLHADKVPENHCAEGLTALLADEAKAGKRFLSVRGDKGRKVLKEGLAAFGGSVTEISVYQSVPITKAEEKILRKMEAGEIDFVTVTSPAIAEALDGLFGDLLSRTRLVSMSPLTSQKIRELGKNAALEAEEASMDGILRALCSFGISQKESID